MDHERIVRLGIEQALERDIGRVQGGRARQQRAGKRGQDGRGFRVHYCLTTPNSILSHHPIATCRSPRKREPMVPCTAAAGMLGPRLRGDNSAASYKPNTNSMVAFLARCFNSGELAIRPIWLRVRPVAMAMY